MNTKHLLEISSLHTHSTSDSRAPSLRVVTNGWHFCTTKLQLQPQKMTMAFFTSKILTFLIISMTLQEGCGLPAAERPEQPVQTLLPHHRRTKRCSCNNWEDNECFYFCHLDIIWVNTPSKILPYGLGNPLSRRRRSASRCECLKAGDKSCHAFCHHSSEDSRRDATGSLAESRSTNNNKLLAFFRSVVKSNTVTANHIQLSEKNPSGVKVSMKRTRRLKE